jgi:hypothetical protein
MIVHHEARVIYLSHPRTASVATEKALRSIGFRWAGKVSRHARLIDSDWWRTLPTAERETFEILTTVRNPYDALASWWHHRDLGHPRLSVDWVHAFLAHDPKYVMGGRLWALHGDDATTVLRFESIADDLEDALASAGLDMPDFPLLNRTQRRRYRPYWDFYDDETAEYVAFCLAEDLSEYGYEWEGSAALTA